MSSILRSKIKVVLNKLHHDTFSSLISEVGLATKAYPRSSDAIEAAELLVTIEQLGDGVLKLVKNDKLSAERGAELIQSLTVCYADPLKDTRSIVEIGNKLKGYGR